MANRRKTATLNVTSGLNCVCPQRNSGLHRVLDGMRTIDRIEDLKAYCTTIDELFLNKEISLNDCDWSVINQAVAIKMHALTK